MKNMHTKRSFFMVILGVVFEHFDMMLVSLLASSIIIEFVGNTSSALTLLYAYVGYAIAFLFRPLGAFCFGFIGDLYGRKVSLISSMVLMSSAMLGLAFIPGVKILGIISTLLFLLCRIAQGMAVGGEYGTAMTYAFELNSKYRTFSGACLVASTHIGGIAASFLAGMYVENFRMIFLLGGLVGFFLLLFRSFMKEYHIVTAKKISEITTVSIKDKTAILKALIVASMLVLVFYGSLIYLNEFIYQTLHISRSIIFKGNTLLLALWVLVPPCIGYIVDKFAIPYRRLMKLGAIGVFLSAPILGLTLLCSFYPAILAAQILLHLFHMIFCLCTPRFFGDLFSASARNTLISTTYSLGASFTAALAPMICYASRALFQTSFAICIPFMLIAVAAIFILKKETVYAKR